MHKPEIYNLSGILKFQFRNPFQMNRNKELLVIVCQGCLQINVNTGKYLYMHISHTE